jgi:hypothetical protein
LWKEGFADESHLYKKRKTQEIVHNAEETFAQQFFNFMRKNPQYVVQIPSPEINLELGATVQQPFAPSSAGSAPNRDKDKYPMDDIKDPTPCTLMYVKGRTSRTIEVAEATVMHSCILHGRSVPAECAVVEVTTIREGHEFKEPDYPNEDEGIEKLIDAKGTFILWPRKDIIVKTRSSSIVLPQSIEVWCTPTSNMPKPTQSSHPLVTPPPAQNLQDPDLQESTGRRPPSPMKESQGPELQDNRSIGRLLLMLEAKSSRTIRSVGRLILLLETKSSRATRSVGHLLLLLQAKSSRATRSVGRLLLLLDTMCSRATRSVGHLLLLET